MEFTTVIIVNHREGYDVVLVANDDNLSQVVARCTTYEQALAAKQVALATIRAYASHVMDDRMVHPVVIS